TATAPATPRLAKRAPRRRRPDRGAIAGTDKPGHAPGFFVAGDRPAAALPSFPMSPRVGRGCLYSGRPGLDGSHMAHGVASGMRAARILFAMGLALALAAGLGACKRDPNGQLPAAGGEAIQARQEAVKGFAVVRAWPDQRNEGLAVAVEFSRPLVGTQDFDKLLSFAPAAGNDDSSWSLSDDGRTLRYPYVEPNKT